MDTLHTMLKSARSFFCGTFLSRLSGYGRDVAMAFCFGASAEVAGFLVAFRLANLFRRVLGEGNLQSGFIPQFESLRQESFEKAVHFYRDAALFFLVISVGVIFAFEGILWFLLDAVSASWQEIVRLTMWMLPSLLFICLSGLNQALLQSQKKYFWPAFAPVIFNAAWIVAAFISRDMTELAIWVAAGSFFQWLFSSLQVRKEFLLVKNQKRAFFSPSCQGLIRFMMLGLLGVAAMQINSALDAIFARMADASGPVYLLYAIRVQQLPLALFGLALSGALLPPLSRAVRNGDMSLFYEFLGSSLKRGAALMIPSTFALFALGSAGLHLLFGHGHFHAADVQNTVFCLWAYAAGLIPSVFVLLLSQAFYAQNMYWIPARATLYAVGLNIFLNALFVFGLSWGAASIAWATSLSSLVDAYLLARRLSRSIDFSLIQLSIRLSVASLVPAALCLFLQNSLFQEPPLRSIDQIGECVFLAAVYLTGVAGLARALSIHELWEVLSGWKKIIPDKSQG